MLYKETVEPGTLGLLKQIVTIPGLQQFRLVGGTALSLLFGHRKSIDLDFFTDTPFDKELLSNTLNENYSNIAVTNNRYNSIYQCIINEVKVDFVSVKDKFTRPVNIVENIPFAAIEDIIALKLNAVKGRGVKKDFWDIAKLLQFYTLENLFSFYNNRYPYDDTFAVIRSIVYFTDAEDTVAPVSLDGMTWDKVKKTIVKAFDDYYRNIRN